MNQEQLQNELQYGEHNVIQWIKENISTDLDIVDIANKFFKEQGLTVDSTEIISKLTVFILIQDKYSIQGLLDYVNKLIIDNISIDFIKATELSYGLLKTLDNKLIIISGLSVQSKYALINEARKELIKTCFLPPMVCKPLQWTNNKDGGYLTKRQSVIHGGENHHNKYQCLDVINILQDISFELDPDILQVEEPPNKPLDTIQKHEQFLDLKIQSREIYEQIKDPFYFVWRYDKRGRMYSQGYHINLQSTSYKKALLNFSNKELIEGEL